MKKIKNAFIAMAVAIASMTAFAGSAHAQNIDLTYKATNGLSFNVKNAQKIVGLPGSINVIDETGYSSTSALGTQFTDSSSLVYDKIVNDPVFLALFIQIGTTKAWVNPAYFRDVDCKSSKSIIRYKNWPTDNIADNCQFFNAYNARAQ